MEELKKILLVRKTAAAADNMGLQEIEEKVDQYCKLWELFADASYELARKSKSSPTEATKACKIYEPYICDILQKVDAVMTIFAMEKELRNLKGRGHFPIPHGIRIDKPQHARKTRKTLDAVDDELMQILNIIRESERNYEKENEEARLREQQARSNRAAKGLSTTTSAQTPAHQSRTQTPQQATRTVRLKVSTSTPTLYSTTTL